MADIERILIVGGGIAGLSAAATLGRQRFSAELVEADDRRRNQPAGQWRARSAGAGAPRAERNAAVVRRWGFFDQHGAAGADCRSTDSSSRLWSRVGPARLYRIES